MKSFKNHFNRSKSVSPLLLLNGTFDTPILPILTFSYFNNLTVIQKRDFIWIGAGNILNGLGPVLIHGFNSWNFRSPFPTSQIVGLQSNSSIEQSLFLNAGTYNLSFLYCSRSGNNNNPVNCLIDDVIIATTPNIVAGSWTNFNISFTIIASKIIVLKLSGSVLIDQTTAISNIIIT